MNKDTGQSPRLNTTLSPIRITFYLTDIGLPMWLIKEINFRVKALKSTTKLRLIRNHQLVDISNYLNLISLAFKPYDLCQLEFSGEDKPNQFNDLLSFLEQECVVIGHNLNAPIPILNINNVNSTFESTLSIFHYLGANAQKQLNAFTNLYSKFQTQKEAIEKEYLLKLIAQSSHCSAIDQIEAKLKDREKISSTGLRSGVAMPHLLTPLITTPQVITLTIDSPVNWQSKLGLVTHIVAVLLPIDAPKSAIMATRKLAIKLATPENATFLCQHTSTAELRAIINCFMTH